MVLLSDVQASNASLSSHGPGLVGIFVGGNSGIGASTVLSFARSAKSPKIYILARNETTAEDILSQAKDLNPDIQGTFLKVDATSLKDIKRAANEIKQREKEVNFIVLTCGGFSFTGREETPEGLDRKMTLNFYARTLFISSLLPLLRAGAANHKLARVVSILGGGREKTIDSTDLGLEKPGNYSLPKQFAHCITMTSLLFESWADKYPEIGWVHQYPGYVKTKQVDSLGLYGWWAPLRWLLRGVEVLASPLAVGLAESGERTLFIAVSGRYPAGKDKAEGKGEVMVGSDGERGSGSYILGWDGESTANKAVMKTLREEGLGGKVWEHVQETWKRVLGETSG